MTKQKTAVPGDKTPRAAAGKLWDPHALKNPKMTAPTSARVHQDRHPNKSK